MQLLAHVALALLIQYAVARLCGSWIAGATTATAWSLSREITQAEYRWIEAFGGGLRANMPVWGGLDPRVWQKADPWLDWVIPTVAVVAIAFAMRSKSSAREDGGSEGPHVSPP